MSLLDKLNKSFHEDILKDKNIINQKTIIINMLDEIVECFKSGYTARHIWQTLYDEKVILIGYSPFCRVLKKIFGKNLNDFRESLLEKNEKKVNLLQDEKSSPEKNAKLTSDKQSSETTATKLVQSKGNKVTTYQNQNSNDEIEENEGAVIIEKLKYLIRDIKSST